jgi:dihydrofolate synthase/folylpolyglutamate synthase
VPCAEVLAQTMADFEEASSRPLHLVLGMMKRKDADAFIAVFEDLCELVLTVPVPGSGAEGGLAWQPDELAELAEEHGIRAIACDGVLAALAESERHARELGGEPVRVLICGSLYLAGHVLELYGQRQRT